MTAVDPNFRIIGDLAPRVDAKEKVFGTAVFTADITLPGMLHAKILRSAIGHARLIKIDATKARLAPGVHAVLTRDELDRVGSAFYGYFIKDQPIVAIDKLRYQGDTIAAVAAETEAQAEAALALIRVQLEELTVVPNIDAALSEDAPELFEDIPMGVVPKYGTGASGALWPKKNICYLFRYETGSESVFQKCDHIFEDEFRFSRMHHFHLEPFVTVANASRERMDCLLYTSDAADE